MKLDYECVRNVLLALEDLCGYDENTSSGFKEILCQDIMCYILDTSDFAYHSIDEIKYTVSKLQEGGFIVTDSIITECQPVKDDILYILNCKTEIFVKDITYQGHELISTIRDPKFIRNIKSGIDGLPNSNIKAFLKMILH
ncbi:MAG: DUF2513 domain-containing protein [Ruminococcus sp.]|nr:DUF2513 domain-containing protein [Ruminococcus sp.]